MEFRCQKCFASRVAESKDDEAPVTDDWLGTIFNNISINGHSLLIDGGDGDPVELFILEDLTEAGKFGVSLSQSNPADCIAITGRYFRTRGDVRSLLASLGHSGFH